MVSKLQKTREKAGYTIEQVAEKLNIKRQYIAYLEEENFQKLPGEVYVRGYTKLYCDFLGIEYSDKQKEECKPLQKIKVNSNLQYSQKRYTLLFSGLMLIATISLYLTIKTKEMNNIEHNSVIQIYKEHADNKTKLD